jgi:hypothetical protein
MPGGFDNKTCKAKWGNIHARVRSNLIAMVWKDKQEMHTLMNTHTPLAECNFCDEQGETQKPVT